MIKEKLSKNRPDFENNPFKSPTEIKNEPRLKISSKTIRGKLM